MCLQRKHQNVKWKLAAYHITDDYNLLISKTVCALINKNFMLLNFDFQTFSYLLVHHYIMKHQTQHQKSTKENLKAGEPVTLMNHAENCSFVVQDFIGRTLKQSYIYLHFDGYYNDNEIVRRQSFFIIMIDSNNTWLMYTISEINQIREKNLGTYYFYGNPMG